MQGLSISFSKYPSLDKMTVVCIATSWEEEDYQHSFIFYAGAEIVLSWTKTFIKSNPKAKRRQTCQQQGRQETYPDSPTLENFVSKVAGIEYERGRDRDKLTDR